MIGDKRCPVCGTGIRLNFPDDCPTHEDVAIRWAQALYEFADQSMAGAARAAGLSVNTMKRLVKGQARSNRPMTDAEKKLVLRTLKARQPLRPVENPGACGGDWGEVGKSSVSSCFDIHLNEHVDSFDSATFVRPGQSPFVCLFEADDETPRTFEFGSPLDAPSVCGAVMVGPRHLICFTMSQDLYDRGLRTASGG